ncbi:DoxX family protein [Quadrisphaera sp. DSM 44207]|uniref:DoxX family protein n=1 Tax=Quadrisphaera sp. DSM 44207 TaxID=1881057 RepID=UPI001C40BAB4|nr:DoxX family protein [Quadrisphaera sp. DSM 44207]
MLVIRGGVGALFAGHGAGKLFGAFGAGYGVEGTAGFMESLGFRPGRPYAVLSGATELVAGLGLAAGLATPLSAAGVIGQMVGAARTAHRGKGVWVTGGGWELPLINGVVAAGIAATGPGRYSLDRVLGVERSGPGALLTAVGVGLGTAALVLSRRQEAPSGDDAPGANTTADPTADPT